MNLEEIIEYLPIKKEERTKVLQGDKNAEEHRFTDIPQDDTYVPDTFINIAKCILSGHFQIKEGDEDVRKVIPTCVEIYYHEESDEKDAIKDYIVYHRNNRNKGKSTPGTFRLGSLNTHQSGIDITFEYQDDNKHIVRASALIREYQMENLREGKGESPLYVNIDNIDKRSTYLYEALFADLSIIKGFSIQWVDGENEVELAEPAFRKNVLPYENAQKTTNKEIKTDGRCWQFRNIIPYSKVQKK